MRIPINRDLRRLNVLLLVGIIRVAEPRNADGARERVMELRSERKTGQGVLGFFCAGYGAVHSS